MTFLRKIMVMHDYGDWEAKEPILVCSPTLKNMYQAMREAFPAVINGTEEDNKLRNQARSFTYDEFKEKFMREVQFYEETTGEVIDPTDSKILRSVEFDLDYWGHRIIFREIPYQRTLRTART